MTAADVVVIGAGPAGMAAAIAAGDAGAAVTVIDDGWLPGGQYHRQPPPQLRAGPGVPIVEAVQRHPRIALRQNTRVWRAETGDGTREHPHLLFVTDLPEPIEAPRLVIATGAHDRPIPFPGWELPGVMTAGGVQATMKASNVLPGRRVVVAGTGPFIIAVAADLIQRGTEVVAVLELRRDAVCAWARSPGGVLAGCVAGKAAEGIGYLRTLRSRRVPVRLGYRIAAARPGPGGEVAEVDVVATRPGAGTETVAVDAVAVGYGFTAALELPVAVGCELVRDPADRADVVRVDDVGQTSTPGVFAAGEITGVGGADLAAAEGRLAGRVAAGGRPPYVWLLRQRMLSRFARALRRAHAIDPHLVARVPGETVVCRCEEVTAGQIRAAVHDLGADDARSVKLLSRAAMGPCQGRICAQNAEAIVADALGSELPDPGGLATRPLAAAVELGDLAALEGRLDL